MEQENLRRRHIATARSLKKQKQRLKAAQNTLNSRWTKGLETEEKYGGSRRTKCYPKHKLLPELDDEALEPIQPISDTANRPDPPPCERDREANKVAHNSTHDLRENLRQKSGATRSIYGSRKRTPAQNQNRILQPSKHHGTSQYRGAAHPLCFTDEVLDHEFPAGFKPVNIEAYVGMTHPAVWIEDFILHIHKARGDDLHTIKYLPLKLKGPARHWLKSLPENSIRS